jgi:IclR family transcriptional regulator, acetate operon repressor
MPDRSSGVQSVHRALDLLEVVAARGGTATIGDIAAAAGVPLPTAHRLLRTLVDRGYMRQAPDRRYALGLGLVPLGAAASAMTGAGTDRLLGALVDELGETANLAMLEGSAVTYVAQVPGRHSMRMFTEVGRRVEAHCTAVGKAMLAQTSDEQARSVLSGSPLTRHTAHTVTDVDALMQQLADIRARGYALDQEEQEVGVRCVAVAVPTTDPRLALSVSGPAPRMTEDVIERAVPLLQRTARSLAATLAS